MQAEGAVAKRRCEFESACGATAQSAGARGTKGARRGAADAAANRDEDADGRRKATKRCSSLYIEPQHNHRDLRRKRHRRRRPLPSSTTTRAASPTSGASGVRSLRTAAFSALSAGLTPRPRRSPRPSSWRTWRRRKPTPALRGPRRHLRGRGRGRPAGPRRLAEEVSFEEKRRGWMRRPVAPRPRGGLRRAAALEPMVMTNKPSASLDGVEVRPGQSVGRRRGPTINSAIGPRAPAVRLAGFAAGTCRRPSSARCRDAVTYARRQHPRALLHGARRFRFGRWRDTRTRSRPPSPRPAPTHLSTAARRRPSARHPLARDAFAANDQHEILTAQARRVVLEAELRELGSASVTICHRRPRSLAFSSLRPHNSAFVSGPA